jgi:hypothetical protein
MPVIVNEMEIVPAPGTPPREPTLAPQPNAPAPARVRLTELAQAQRRLAERDIRVRAH